MKSEKSYHNAIGALVVVVSRFVVVGGVWAVAPRDRNSCQYIIDLSNEFFCVCLYAGMLYAGAIYSERTTTTDDGHAMHINQCFALDSFGASSVVLWVRVA